MKKKTFIAILIMLAVVVGVAIKNAIYEICKISEVNEMIRARSSHPSEWLARFYAENMPPRVIALILDIIAIVIIAVIVVIVIKQYRSKIEEKKKLIK